MIGIVDVCSIHNSFGETLRHFTCGFGRETFKERHGSGVVNYYELCRERARGELLDFMVC